MSKIIETTNPFSYQIKELFKKKKSREIDLIWSIVELLIYEGAKSSDLLDIYHLLDFKEFVKLIALIDGREIRLPTKKDIEENLLTALIHYDRTVLGLSWDEVKAKYPELEISSIKYSLKIKKLNEFLQLRISEMMRELSKSEKKETDNGRTDK